MATIWKYKYLNIEDLNLQSKNSMAEFLEIKFIEAGTNYLKATMPVNHKTHQPKGLLHGGASAALAETIGSVASSLCIDPEKQICVGMEINCNHLGGIKHGIVIATAEPLHMGKRTHVWDIKIRDEKDKLICVSRLTVAVFNK